MFALEVRSGFGRIALKTRNAFRGSAAEAPETKTSAEEPAEHGVGKSASSLREGFAEGLRKLAGGSFIFSIRFIHLFFKLLSCGPHQEIASVSAASESEVYRLSGIGMLRERFHLGARGRGSLLGLSTIRVYNKETPLRIM